MVSRKKRQMKRDKAAGHAPAEEADMTVEEGTAPGIEESRIGQEPLAEEAAAAPSAPGDEAAAEAGGGDEKLKDEIAALEDRHLRLAAEFDNFRKRTLRERAQQSERAQAELVKSLLESLDDLRRVSELGSTDHDAAAILEGVQLVELKLHRALQGFGLKPIQAVGQAFNPEVHEALITVPTETPEEDDIVSEEVSKGYLFKDTLLRPSLVQVKKYDPEKAGGEQGRSPDSGSES